MPPHGFIPVTMQFAMMSSAQWDGELIADLAAQCSRLRKAQTVSISGAPTADQASLLGGSPFFRRLSFAADLI